MNTLAIDCGFLVFFIILAYLHYKRKEWGWFAFMAGMVVYELVKIITTLGGYE